LSIRKDGLLKYITLIKQVVLFTEVLSCRNLKGMYGIIMVQIVTLADKLYAGLISKPIFDRQFRQICPIKKIDWETVVRLYEDSLPKHDSPQGHAGGVICPKSDIFGIGSAR